MGKVDFDQTITHSVLLYHAAGDVSGPRMESNQDKMSSLEEYSDSYQKCLSESFNMIDTNQDSTW
jgi:hypothetical protein